MAQVRHDNQNLLGILNLAIQNINTHQETNGSLAIVGRRQPWMKKKWILLRVVLADKINEYVQYNQRVEGATNEQQVVNQASEPEFSDQAQQLASIKQRLANANKTFLSRRSSIGAALIDRTLDDEKCQLDEYTRRLLRHERSIYETHVIDCKAD